MISTIAKAAAAGVFGVLEVAAPTVAAPANAALAYSFEWDNAVSATPNLSNMSDCISTTGSEVCFQPDGDKIWVKDTSSDGFSAVARWYTDYGRWGTCRNALSAGSWGVCNKDFKENQAIYWRASRYDGDTGQYVGPESGLDGSSTS